MGARASPSIYFLQHGINAKRLKGESGFGVGMDLGEVVGRLGSP
jgi:hypothetical protein